MVGKNVMVEARIHAPFPSWFEPEEVISSFVDYVRSSVVHGPVSPSARDFLATFSTEMLHGKIRRHLRGVNYILDPRLVEDGKVEVAASIIKAIVLLGHWEGYCRNGEHLWPLSADGGEPQRMSSRNCLVHIVLGWQGLSANRTVQEIFTALRRCGESSK